MRRLFLFLLPFFLFGTTKPLSFSMLDQADRLLEFFQADLSRAPPPSLSFQPQASLSNASIWFSLSLSELPQPAFFSLQKPSFWDKIREMGVQGVYLKGLKQGGSFRTGIAIDPKWGEGWDDLALLLQKKRLLLIGDAIGNSTGKSLDFQQALQNVGKYTGLYHLVEVAKNDWKLLPDSCREFESANIPWLSLQELAKKGYIPEYQNPYVKESRWNATGPIRCVDGTVRRWLFLKENRSDPTLNWLSGSFSAIRIAAADLVDSSYNLGQKIVLLSDQIGPCSCETLALWARKIGSFSMLKTEGGLDAYRKAPTDLVFDTWTQSALLHALIAQDAEALRLLYRIFLEEGVEVKRLVHALQPFDKFFPCWTSFLENRRKKICYYDEVLTVEALENRMLKEDMAKLSSLPPTTTWPSLCMAALGIEDLQKGRPLLSTAHLLLCFFYAMQPGSFSFSLSDLLGSLKAQTLDPLQPNEDCLYGSLVAQSQNSSSFYHTLLKILQTRIDCGIDTGELVAVPDCRSKGLLLLVHRLRSSGMLQLLAVNFSQQPVEESLEMGEFRQTTAIDLMTQLSEKKGLDSSKIQLCLPPLSGKAILFQTKYY